MSEKNTAGTNAHSLARLFELDLRSLALARIILGVVLLMSLAERSADLEAHYTDGGTLPRAARRTLDERTEFTSPPALVSLHMLSGEVGFQRALMAAAMIAALLVVIGYRSRMALFIAWVLVIGIQARNPLLLQGGDDVLRLLMFWLLLVPIGGRWSVDRALDRHSPQRDQVASVGTAALVIQLACLYFFTALLKTNSMWCVEQSAIYYAMNIDHFTTGLGRSLLAFPRLLAWGSVATVVLEYAGPLALFVPIHRDRIRLAVVAAFIALHLGLAACLELGFFSYFCVAYWCALLPASFWTSHMAARVASAMDRLYQRLAAAWRAARLPRGEQPDFQLSRITATLLVALIWYVVAVNFARRDANILSNVPEGTIRALGQAAQLQQYWCMFAPRPHTFGGWFALDGILADGRRVNLLHPQHDVDRVKPALVSATYPNQRWRRCVINLIERDSQVHREQLSDYLRRRWNESHGRDEQVVRVEFTHMQEWTHPPGATGPERVDAVSLFHRDYRDP